MRLFSSFSASEGRITLIVFIPSCFAGLRFIPRSSRKTTSDGLTFPLSQACERGKVSPSEVVFLDDLGINLKPAKQLGMKTIKVIRPSDALKELNNLIEVELDAF